MQKDKTIALNDATLFPSEGIKITRCKDCRNADDYNHCQFVDWWTGPDDYCSRAEVRSMDEMEIELATPTTDELWDRLTDIDLDHATRISIATKDGKNGEFLKVIRCQDCKYAEVADPEDNQDGYTCQFHRGSIWFSDSYCSWAERRQDG